MLIIYIYTSQRKIAGDTAENEPLEVGLSDSKFQYRCKYEKLDAVFSVSLQDFILAGSVSAFVLRNSLWLLHTYARASEDPLFALSSKRY